MSQKGYQLRRLLCHLHRLLYGYLDVHALQKNGGTGSSRNDRRCLCHDCFTVLYGESSANKGYAGLTRLGRIKLTCRYTNIDIVNK